MTESAHISIIARTPQYVVIDKPAGLLSVPGKGEDKQDCAIARVRRAIPEAEGPLVVHRLDMDTSGLLLVALTSDAQRTLSLQFENREVDKRYVALVDGHVAREQGTINLPMRLDIDNRPYQIHDPELGKPSVTHYRVLAYEGDRTRVQFEPVTGRSHQLRMHAAHSLGLGHAILGDVLYGDPDSAPRLMLHASFLSFIDPAALRRVEFESRALF